MTLLAVAREVPQSHNEVVRETRSHSQLNSWLKCGKAYELERIRHVPPVPGMWLPAGTACHAVIERWLRVKVQSEGAV